jgi:excisionase family DNA binding protein
LSTNFFDFHPSDWITQAEAARIRKVSRQAIAKLVRHGRLRSMSIGGRVFVLRADVESFIPKAAGRPRSPKPDDAIRSASQVA